jgi:hypothetical protein
MLRIAPIPATILGLALAGGCQTAPVARAAPAATAPQHSTLGEARRELRIAEETLARIEREIADVRGRPAADPAVLGEYEVYHDAVAGMVESQRRVVHALEAVGGSAAEAPEAPYRPEPVRVRDDLAELEKELDGSLSEFDEYLLRQQAEAERWASRVEETSSEEMQSFAEEAAAAVERLREKGVDVNTQGSGGPPPEAQQREGQQTGGEQGSAGEQPSGEGSQGAQGSQSGGAAGSQPDGGGAGGSGQSGASQSGSGAGGGSDGDLEGDAGGDTGGAGGASGAGGEDAGQGDGSDPSGENAGAGQGGEPGEGDGAPGGDGRGEPGSGDGATGGQEGSGAGGGQEGDPSGGGADEASGGDGGSDLDRPPAADDDIVARQLREAAEKETDPELKKRLWEEYDRYKGNT